MTEIHPFQVLIRGRTGRPRARLQLRASLFAVLAVTVMICTGCTLFGSSSQTTSLQPTSPLNLGLGPGIYVALGDSFSAGEGNPPYESGTDIWGVDECHRSHVFAYPVLLSAMPGIPQLTDHSFVACSGAAIQALFDTNNSNPFEVMKNGGAISGQLYAAAFGQPVSLVTLTIGGNDLDFPGILDTCVKAQLPPSCFVKVHSSISTLLPKIDGRQTAGKYTLAGVYLEARKQAPSARILVLGYPHEFNPDQADQFYIGFFPVPGTGRLHLSKDDETVMNSATDAMDAVIRANVELANSRGARIEYVADSVSKFVGHEQDTNSNAFNGFSETGWEKSFHPNKIGQRIYAKAVYDYLQGHPAAPARPKDSGKDLPQIGRAHV